MAEISPLSRLKRTFSPTVTPVISAVLATGNGWVPGGQFSASTVS
jgi:hypothetical protein